MTDPDRIFPVESGVSRSTGTVYFRKEGSLDSRVVGTYSNTTVPVVSIDEFTEGKDPPTLIKMDIEGSEEDALAGARRTIQEYSPRLAISVYHKATDLWRLPLLIRQINGTYQMYLRHYSDEIVDTVCYAVQDERPRGGIFGTKQ